jgi:hypothetical protein
MKQSSKNHFADLARQCEQNIAQYQRHEAKLSWLRLLVFLGGLAGTLVLFKVHWAMGALTGVGALITFIQTVIRHTEWRDRRDSALQHQTVIQESRHKTQVTQTPVRAYVRPGDPDSDEMALPSMFDSEPVWQLSDQELEDLDLYSAPVGLFGLLNRASTDPGARRLRDMLESPCLSADTIERRQHAVAWLADQTGQRLGLMASALPLRDRSPLLDRLVEHIQTTSGTWHGPTFSVLKAWSCLSGLAFFYGVQLFFSGQMSGFALALGVLIVNSLIWAIFRKPLTQLRSLIAPLIPLTGALRCILAHAECAAQALPDQTPLATLKTCFQDVLTHCRINALCEWLDWAGLGAVIRSQFNLIFFYDLHVSEAILKRFEPHRETLLNGLRALADLEAFNSLACFSAEQPVTCFPTCVTHTALTLTQAHHPLIPNDASTPNDMALNADQRIWLITGPNAAGKSTYLRMVGINLLLAQIGSAVTAEAMTFCPLRLITDVRIRDDLAKHESYFMSEVRRLRRIVVDTDTNIPLFCLIDEPFRGTNSPERTAAGVALLEHLLASQHLVLLATHEEQLAQTALRSDAACNHHFQETLTDTGITFEFDLRPGPASTRTAIRILEQEHYPPSLVKRARDLMQASD